MGLGEPGPGQDQTVTVEGNPPAVLRFDEGDQVMRSDTRPVIRWNPVERVWETGCRGYSVLSVLTIKEFPT